MAGDLNFRLNETNLESVFQDISEGANTHDYSGLIAKDQLRDVIQKKLVFSDYQEASIAFPPTFKFEKKEKGKHVDYANVEDVRRVYKTKGADHTMRIPSYVDRIIWHSLPGCNDIFLTVGYF